MKVGIIGAGTMGTGIAQVFLQFSHTVILTDRHEKVLQKSKKTIKKFTSTKKLSLTKDLSDLSDCDLVIEAVVENLKIKKEIFRKLDNICSRKTVFATNTSSLSVTNIAKATKRPGNVIGTHFFNPAPLMNLIEVAVGQQTSQKTIKAVIKISKRIGKVPIVVKDQPGFVANRLLFVMINEAIQSLDRGVAKKEDIDNIAKLGLHHPMGPLELADHMGLDITLDILKTLYKRTGDKRFKPHPMLTKMVNNGHLGRKTGRGFYVYR